MAMDAAPLRTIQKACPMAWLDEEQAVEMVYVGPTTPVSSEMRLAAEFCMARNRERIYARDVVAIKIDEALVFGGLASDAGACDDGCGLAQLPGPLDARRSDGLARRDYSELREAIEQADFFFVEVLGRREVSDLCAIGKTQQRRIHCLQPADAGTSLLQGMPELAAIVADRGDDTQAGDSHPVGHVKRWPPPGFLYRCPLGHPVGHPEVSRYRRLHLEPNANFERLRPEY